MKLDKFLRILSNMLNLQPGDLPKHIEKNIYKIQDISEEEIRKYISLMNNISEVDLVLTPSPTVLV